MKLTEKAAYLQGLIEGMNVKADSNEGKIYAAICDFLAEAALELEDLSGAVDELDEAVGIIDEDLGELEDYTYGDEDEDDDDDDDDDELYSVVCPKCGEELYIDEDIIDDGSIDCPNCGEKLEFDTDEDCCCCDECDCGCDGKDGDKE